MYIYGILKYNKVMNFLSRYQKKSQGFTLIELLVVVAIIAVLMTVAVVGYDDLKVKSRDTARVAEIKEIHKSLEAYFSDNASYPQCGSGWCTGSSFQTALDVLVTDGYISEIVQDPLSSGSYSYGYYTGGGSSDALCAGQDVDTYDYVIRFGIEARSLPWSTYSEDVTPGTEYCLTATNQ